MNRRSDPEGDELTLVTWGAMVCPSLEAAAGFEGRNVPIPYNAGLMKAVLPSTERIEGAIEELLAF